MYVLHFCVVTDCSSSGAVVHAKAYIDSLSHTPPLFFFPFSFSFSFPTLFGSCGYKGRELFSKTISDVEDMFNAVDSDNSDGVDIDELRDGLERLGVWLGQVSAIKSENSFLPTICTDAVACCSRFLR